ncbi:MAG: transcription-repair coupling factor, partial [Clostridia bacterium]|nr:transcription-repair coupling factor [Clostridia bacterium]
MMNKVIRQIRSDREYAALIQNIRTTSGHAKKYPALLTGLCDAAKFPFYSALIKDVRSILNVPLLFVLSDEKECRKAGEALAADGFSVFVYPYRDLNFYSGTSSHEFEHERLKVLSALINDRADAVFTTPEATLQYTIPPEKLIESTFTLTSGESSDPEEIRRRLDSMGYVHADMVDGSGQYSSRGSILDIFPACSHDPVRIDFFGDEIDEISFFDVMTQRRIKEAGKIEIAPAHEVIADESSKAAIMESIKKLLKKYPDSASSEELEKELEALDSGVGLSFVDKYISLIYPERTTLTDYFSAHPFYVVQEYGSIEDKLRSIDFIENEKITSMLEARSIESKYADHTKNSGDFFDEIDNSAGVICNSFIVGSGGKKLSGIFTIPTKQGISYYNKDDLLFEDVVSYLRTGYSVLIITESGKSAGNLSELLRDKGIPSVISAEPSVGIVSIDFGFNVPSFELTKSKFACMSLLPSAEISAYRMKQQSRILRSKKKKKSEAIMSYADLQVGDYVVHEGYGIGQYLGITPMVVDGVKKDYIDIRYAGKDVLHIPCDRLDMISKYIGAKAESGTLKLSKLGGTEWIKAKTKAKGAAKEMAKELIELYAKRLRLPGFAFPEDDEMQMMFEAGFEYPETDGQLIAIREIKDDMQKPHPMDRLLCGDVGFGKTEVALRAAFKAVAASKQAALLCPTTILAMQHFQTMLSRMRDFPVTVEMVSRFRTAKQTSEIFRRLKRGEIDILVGTHKLLSKDIQFKDLGLLIIDEEQRFGVAQKEKLKQLATNVDVLTLTATPIPRTLNMAMSGIKDISILEEAPGDRFPVQTYVLEYDNAIVYEAIRRELARNGQVFYLHNTVENISSVADRISGQFPEARVAYAHGQMDKDKLAAIWESLMTGELDILVSTTIIETGVDIPNANTLIIENADKMGLAQLHQIRGRIGRSSRRAFAYLTYPKGKVLTEDAAKRLASIRDYTEFGSGFKIALRDLEIRGAGNILGSEQHGHIENVGYDLYMKLLNQAVIEEKGGKEEIRPECSVEIKTSAYIPETYIRTSQQRIDTYKKISLIETTEDLSDIEDELRDRYGDLPRPVRSLLKISLIRSIASSSDIVKITSSPAGVRIFPRDIVASVSAWT